MTVFFMGVSIFEFISGLAGLTDTSGGIVLFTLDLILIAVGATSFVLWVTLYFYEQREEMEEQFRFESHNEGAGIA